MSKKFMDDIFDNLLEASANALADKDLYAEECDEIEFSQVHQKKMNELFRIERKKHKKIQQKKSIRKIIAAIAVLIIILSISVMSVSAWRVKLLNFVINISQTDSDIDFDAKESNSYDFDGIKFNYIPDGFVLTKKNDTSGLYLKFENDQYYFTFKMSAVTANISIDTENADVEKININEYEAIYSENDNHGILVWHDDNFSYTLISNLDKNKIFAIAENTESCK